MKVKGLTLAEVLVSMAIGSLVLGIFYAFVATQTKSMKKKVAVDSKVILSSQILESLRSHWERRDAFTPLEVSEDGLRFEVFPAPRPADDNEGGTLPLDPADRWTFEARNSPRGVVIEELNPRVSTPVMKRLYTNTVLSFLPRESFWSNRLTNTYGNLTFHSVMVSISVSSVLVVSNAVLPD